MPPSFQLPAVARELGVPERTLRRAAERGTLRCARRVPRRIEFSDGETEYLRRHWMLLSALMQALRTERAVRLAVLFGSVARGSERPGSDLDMLVDMTTQDPAAMAELTLRLTRASAREAHLVVLAQAAAQAPQVVLSAIDDGRVLTDRDGGWTRLCRRRNELDRAAQQSRDRARQEASEALAALGGRP